MQNSLPRWKKVTCNKDPLLVVDSNNNSSSTTTVVAIDTNRRNNIEILSKSTDTNNNHSKSSSFPQYAVPNLKYRINLNELYNACPEAEQQQQEQTQPDATMYDTDTNHEAHDDDDDNDSNSSSSTLEEYHDLITGVNKSWGVPQQALKCDYYGRRKLFAPYLQMKMDGSGIQWDIDKCYKEYYHTWSDCNPKNNLILYTSIFVCPLTGELFKSGRWKYDKEKPQPNRHCHKDVMIHSRNPSPQQDIVAEEVEQNDLIITDYWWFPKKKWSEGGAAALCFDCKVYREREVYIERQKNKLTTTPPRRRRKENTVAVVPKVAKIGLEKPYVELDSILSIPNNDYVVPITIIKTIMEQQSEIFARNLRFKQYQQQLSR